MKEQTKVDVWYGTPFPSRTHIVKLNKDNPAFANLVCTGRRLKYQGLSAGVGFEEVTCQRCIKKLESGNYQHIDKVFAKNAKDELNCTQEKQEDKKILGKGE